MKRNYSIDLMRIFLCLCVIGAHSLEHFGIENYYTNAILTFFLLQANGAFFVLSGYFNLEQEFKDSTDIKKYYKHKIIYILLPFLAFIFVWAVWDYIHDNGCFDILGILKSFYESFMFKSSNDHMWFMYPLFGLLLSTPFLSKMLHSMDDKELKIIWYITLIWNIIAYYICYDMGNNFKFMNWIIDGWLFYYFAGYYYRHIISKESNVKWAIIGISCFILTNLGVFFMPIFEGVTDFQPMFVVFCVCCLMFWDKVIKVNNEKIQKIIVFLSRNTFFIYLFHMRAMEYATRKLSISGTGFVSWILVIISTFVIALIASIIANALLKPIQKYLDKKWIIK